MKSQYHYLVAGLPEITPDDVKLTVSYIDYLEELMQALLKSDESLLRFFRMTYENRNLLAWLNDKEAVLHPLGQLTAEDFQEQLQLIDYQDRSALEGVPPYFLTFLREREEGTLLPQQEESRLTALYYDYAQSCSNRFVREWFGFEKNLKNVLTAVNCRKHRIEIAPHLVGDDEITQALASSTARDFNLSSIFPPVESILRICEEDNLLEREKRIDRLKWNYLDEMCSSYYFTVEILLAYLLKVQGLERWMSLDARLGEEKFRNLIHAMKENVTIPV